MIKKTLYIVSVVCVLALTVMILLNGLKLVDYRLNTISSYVSRGLIAILIILFCLAIVNVRKNTNEPEETRISERPVPRTVSTHKQAQAQASRPVYPMRPVQHESIKSPAVERPQTAATPAAPKALPHLTNRVSQLSRPTITTVPVRPAYAAPATPAAHRKPMRPPRLVQ